MADSDSASHTDPILLPKTQVEGSDSVPCCSHGPTLMFERFDKSTKALRKFYACSAFRDRKACDFFKWADGIGDYSNSLSGDHHVKQPTHQKLTKKFRTFKALPRQDRHVCCSCGLLLLLEDVKHHKSQGHILKSNVGLNLLRRPSSLFKPLENNKTYAQFLFSEETVKFVIETLTHLSFTDVLCVGVPRIHEEIQCMNRKGNTELKSFLLDLDDRYAQVYPRSSYSKYNMFNHHFFETKGKTSVRDFLANGDKIILVTDPPFGGMVEPVANSLIELSHLPDACKNVQDTKPCQLSLPLIWFFPYFMERRILDCLPSMSMLDYKVEYDNHNLYKNIVKKKGSPVRMFTSLPPALVKLPTDDSYWFCDICQRYSAPENVHCKECGSCTSKDGSRYVHCDMCLRCVKPSRIHCFKCETCLTQDHICGQVVSSGCFNCGEKDHKKRDCPKRFASDSAAPKMNRQRVKKRPSSVSNDNAAKRRKRSNF